MKMLWKPRLQKFVTEALVKCCKNLIVWLLFIDIGIESRLWDIVMWKQDDSSFHDGMTIILLFVTNKDFD